jgi:ATP-dependent exoDNAse (exonuclease V) beta subunit
MKGIDNSSSSHSIEQSSTTYQGSLLPIDPRAHIAMNGSDPTNASGSEMNMYCCREDTENEKSCLELFRRAIEQRDLMARETLHQYFGKILSRWMQSHPKREAACRFDSEENYIIQALERFWQVTIQCRCSEFNTLSAALQYLRACLNGTILDKLRAYERQHEVLLPESTMAGESIGENREESQKLWKLIHALLPDGREQRMAYLLFNCRLKPKEIVQHYPQEFSEIHEVYHLRHSIVEKLIQDTLKY